jgi:eukaryotic-like serine/threonine-protein kinase
MNPDRWLDVERLFNSVMELPPEKRTAFLRQACRDDESLRMEVELLMANDSEAQAFMKSRAMNVAAKALGKETPAMEDLTGRTLLHYRITAKVGSGGMGDVYRAHDSKLKRDVALKVLPDTFAGDAERLARFEREARLLASLNHPNIASIYGFEEAEDKRFLVLEMVEGKSLAERIGRGAIPIKESLDICFQIAEGLGSAHEKGIIHRDLKPANVKITPEGKIKILDFGLARALNGQAAADPSSSPTITNETTHPGVILGTAAYMSPEQARGETADKRTDIWAFGCVLYECLTGKRAFPGDTITETVAGILKSEPDWMRLPAETPAVVRSLLRRCLQKDARRRLHDIADACIEIGESEPGESALPPAASSEWRKSLPLLVFVGVAMVIAGIFLGRNFLKLPQSAPSSTIESTIKIEPGHWLEGLRYPNESQRPTRTAMAIARDGEFVVYSAIEENPGPQAKPRLYLRRLGQAQARPILGTEGGMAPFLSPDDRYVGFWADSKLKKIPVEGGVATSLCNAAPYGANWGRDNSIIFANEIGAAGLSRVSADGGKPEILTKPDPKREEVSHYLPRWLADGRTVLFTIMRHGWDPHPSLALLRLDTHEWQVLLEDAADATYIPTGHLVFLRQGMLMAARFDLAELKVTDQPAVLLENVAQAFSRNSGYNTGAGQFSISDTGTLIYVAGGIIPAMENSLVWVDQKGTEQPATTLQFPFGLPRLSPDGQKVAYVSSGLEQRVWVYDLARGTNTRLTDEGRADWLIWSPDSKRILFAWLKSLRNNLFWQPCDGSTPMERLTTSEFTQYPGSWLPNGQTVAVVEGHPGTSHDIVLLDVRTGRVTPFLNSKFSETHPEFSPDGRWIAYSSDHSGRKEVYVEPFPRSGGRWQISTDGGLEPLWSRNGKQLFYRFRFSGKVWAVDLQIGASFSAGKPRLLFDKPGFGGGSVCRNWDISLDSQRFLMVKLDAKMAPAITEMALVLNWFEQLKHLAPAAKK